MATNRPSSNRDKRGIHVSYVAHLDWDSSFFGFPIGKIHDDVPASELGSAVQEADKRLLQCTFLLVAADDYDLLDSARQHGFIMRDIRVELNRPVAGHPTTKTGLRAGRLEDLPKLREIARVSFRGTRFFADRRFPADRSAELYVELVRKGLTGEPGWTSIVTDDLCGFVVCYIDRSAGIGAISLIGVSQSKAGKGMGRALMAGAGKVFTDESLLTAKVVTQGHNIAAQRLYQAQGYRTIGTKLWLHRWSILDH